MAEPQGRSLLEPGETLLWSGKPMVTPYVVPSPRILPALIFLAIWGFVFFGFTSGSAPLEFIIIPLLVLIIMIVAIFWIPLKHLFFYRGTEYMVTDRRIISQTGTRGIKVTSMDLAHIHQVYVTVNFMERRSNAGTIILQTADGNATNRVGRAGVSLPRLESVEDPYSVKKLIEEAVTKKGSEVEQANRSFR